MYPIMDQARACGLSWKTNSRKTWLIHDMPSELFFSFAWFQVLPGFRTVDEAFLAFELWTRRSWPLNCGLASRAFPDPRTGMGRNAIIGPKTYGLEILVAPARGNRSVAFGRSS